MPRFSEEHLEAEVLFQIKQHKGRKTPVGRWELVAKIFGPVAAGDQNDNNPR